MGDEVITVQCSPQLRFEGSQVTGFVNLNTLLAKDKGVVAVRVSLRGQVRTWIEDNTHDTKVIDTELLFKIERTLWSADVPIPGHSYAQLNLPFSLTIPYANERPLPASLNCGGSDCGARIQYYVHAVAEKKAWCKYHTRVNVAFPLLPVDRTRATAIQFDPWGGPWRRWEKTISVRANFLRLFGSSGSVSVTLELPDSDYLPLRTRIPCRIHILCSSHPLSSSHSLNPTSFTFPRNPKPSDIRLEIIQTNSVKAVTHRRSFKQGYGLVGGFGSTNPDDLGSIRTQSTEQTWVPLDEGKTDKGRWVEGVTYTTSVVFRCPVAVQTRLIQSEIKISARIAFPGLGNDWHTMVGPLAISSGIPGPELEWSRSGEQFDYTMPP